MDPLGISLILLETVHRVLVLTIKGTDQTLYVIHYIMCLNMVLFTQLGMCK